MIVNNYAAMNTIETKYKKQQINQKELFDLHLLLTKNDPEIDKSERGRYRLDSDEIFVGNLDNNIAYTPPNARFLKQEMPKFFTYINDTDETSRRYIHPVIKAIIIHFWFAILHPFTDGNGRLARCLFYWYLIKHGYEAISFIPISTVILKSPSQYANAYLYSEQDNLNMTYFYDYQLNKIKQAITDFNNYISKQINNNYTWENKLKNTNLQNNRQVKALSYLLASKAQYITIASYINLTGVKRITASKDIAFLTKQNWLEPKKEGKTNLYYPTQKLIKFGV